MAEKVGVEPTQLGLTVPRITIVLLLNMVRMVGLEPTRISLFQTK